MTTASTGADPNVFGVLTQPTVTSGYSSGGTLTQVTSTFGTLVAAATELREVARDAVDLMRNAWTAVTPAAAS